MYDKLLTYDLGPGVEAASTRRDSSLPFKVVTGHQVHEDKIAIITRADISRDELPGCDAYVTNLPGCAIGVRTADCVPVLLYDPVRRVVAAVHAGWKGTVKRIPQKTITTLITRFRTRPEDLVAVIGPSISADSFQVGEEVVTFFKQQGFPMDEIWSFRGPVTGRPMEGGHHIDLWSANRWLLEQSGVRPEKIRVAGIDTYTTPDFFSARREGTRCGRIISAIRLV